MNKRTVVQFDEYVNYYMVRVDGEDEYDEGKIWYEIFENNNDEDPDNMIIVEGPNAKRVAHKILTALNKRTPR